MKSISPPASKKMWLLIVIAMAICMTFGLFGWIKTLQAETGHFSWSEVVEYSLEMVHGKDTIVVDHRYAEHWALVTAKWGVKVVLVAALIQSAIMVFWRRLRVWRFRRVEGHHVYIGLGQRSRALALRDIEKKLRVAVIDHAQHHDAQTELESHGALFLNEGGEDKAVLAKAGINRAGRVLILTGSDEANVMIAERVLEVINAGTTEKNPAEVLVAIDSSHFRQLLGLRWHLMHGAQHAVIKLVDFRSVALRKILKDLACTMAVQTEIRQRGPRILLAASADFAEEFLKLAISFLQFSGDTKPQFTVTVVDKNLREDFHLKYPEVELVANVKFVESRPDMVAWAGVLEGEQFDHAVVALAGEAETLRASEAILRSPRVRTNKVAAIVSAPPVIKLRPDPALELMSLFYHGTQSPEFGDITLENQARANHDAYLAGLNTEDRRKAPSWEELPEVFKESNRWAVLHRAVKVAIWSKAAEADKPQLLELLAVSEHQRWAGEKVMDGWCGGPVRDEFRKIHPDICPYAKLNEETKEKDRVQVRKALGLT